MKKTTEAHVSELTSEEMVAINGGDGYGNGGEKDLWDTVVGYVTSLWNNKPEPE